MIKEGIYEGYSDPDLATILSFRKRGFLPDTIREVILELGIKPVEAKISLENIYAINRKKIDAIANRYFFVSDPVELNLIHDKEIIVKRQLHPSKTEYYELKLTPKNGIIKLYISKSDYKDEIRLIELGNVKIYSKDEKSFAEFIDDQTVDYARNKSLNFVQWVYDEFKLDAVVKCPSFVFDKKFIKGYVEKEIQNIKIGTVIQFLRFGFVKLDEFQDDKVIFYYTHN